MKLFTWSFTSSKKKKAAKAALLKEKSEKGEEESKELSKSDDEFTVTIDDALCGEDRKKLSVDDFALKKVLGKGSFGKVMLVTKKNDPKQTLLAMKTLRKAALLKRNQIGHTATERHVLQHLNHPFLVRLMYAFQTRDKLYMVLEYMGGGELFHWLKQHKRFSEARTKLYGAEIGLGLSALHNLDIVYRDLKPENLLLDTAGHIRITDFGLAKDGVLSADAEHGTRTFCGTPEYLAPEILQNKGHGKAVDWWSYGTLLYEMMAGLPPFYDQNVQRMYTKIMTAPLKFPAHFPPHTKSLLSALLQRSVTARLGSSSDDFIQIQSHPFFAALDFSRVLSKKYKPEFVPPASGLDQATNFDLEFTSEKPIDSHVTTTLNTDQVQKSHFENFTYEHDSAIGAGRVRE